MSSEKFDPTKDDLREFLRLDVDGSRVHEAMSRLVARHKELSAQRNLANAADEARRLGASSDAMMIAANIVEKLSSQLGR
jgi:hypothetical protein